MEKCVRTIAFIGILIIDVVIVIGILLPISIVELTTNKELGTYNTIEKMYNFTIKIGTGE